MIFTSDQAQLLFKVVEIGSKRAAHLLRVLIGSEVTLGIPCLKLGHSISGADAQPGTPQVYRGECPTVVSMTFDGAFSGTSYLVFDSESASRLGTVLSKEDPRAECGEDWRNSAISEVGNILLNSLVGAMGNVLGEVLSYSTPQYCDNKPQLDIKTDGSVSLSSLLAGSQFHIEDHQVSGAFYIQLDSQKHQAFFRALNRTLIAA